MKHCIAVYWDSVKDGDRAIYRLLQPERVTVELRRHGDEWRIGEIAGYAKAEISASTISFINWLSELKLEA